MGKYQQAMAIAGTVLGCAACSPNLPDELEDRGQDLGVAEIELTNTPRDAACLRITVSGHRHDSRLFPIVPGKEVLLLLRDLPVGTASVSSHAFGVSCDEVLEAVEPTWFSEAENVKIHAHEVVHVALAMIRDMPPLTLSLSQGERLRVR